MEAKIYREITQGKKSFQKYLAKIILWFLGRGIQAAAAYDPIVKEEITIWEDSMTIMFKIGDFGPSMSLVKKKDKIVYLGLKETENADLAIFFKNISTANLILTGQLGIAQGFAEHRFTMKGDLAFGMSLVRILYIVESYLFPRFMTKKILKRMPARGSNSFKIYIGTIFGVK